MSDLSSSKATGAAPAEPASIRLPTSRGRLDLSDLPAALVVSMGVAVMLGWVFHVRMLTQVLPTLTSMVLNTALCFVLMGVALLLPRPALQPPRPLALLLSAAVLALVLLTQLQNIAGISLGLDAAQFHRWAQDGNPHPGRMATPTSIAFAVASLSLLLLGHRGLPMAVSVRRTGRALACAVGLIGLVSIVGYALTLEKLYSWYALSRMALHTAFGMAVLALALWQAWDRRCGQVIGSHEGRIVGLSAVMVVSVSLLTALIGFVIFRDAYQNALQTNLASAYETRTRLIATTLDLRSTRAAVVASRPGLTAALRRLISHAAGPSQELEGIRDLEGSLPLGFAGFTILSPDGQSLARVGAMETPTVDFEVPLRARAPGTFSLLWHDGWILRAQHRLQDARGELGSLISEQPLPTLRDAIFDLADVGRSGEFELCATAASGLNCFSTRQHSEWLAVPDNLSGTGKVVSRIEDGAAGATIMTSGPVAETGLSTRMRVAVDEFYAPIRSRLLWGGVLVALAALAGVALLRRRVHPLIDQLAVIEARHRTLVDSLQEGMVLLDADSRVLSCNPAGLRMIGHAGVDIRGISAFDPRWRAVREDGSPLPNAEFPTIETLKTGAPQSDVLIGLFMPDDSLRWLNFNTAPVDNVSGNGRRGVIASFTDVTERRTAEMRAQEIERRFTLLVDSVSDYAILMLNGRGYIQSWNRGAERIKGYVPSEIIGRHFSCFYTDDDKRADIPGQKLSLAARDGRCEDEGWRVRKDGSRFWASATITAVKDDAGRLIGYAKVTRDLSERRAAEDALRQSEARFRELVDGIADAVISFDGNHDVQSFSPAAERMFGLPAASVIGCNAAALMPDRFRAGNLAWMQQVMEDRTLAANGLRREVMARRGDGSEFPIMLTLSIAPGPGPARVVALATDLTETRKSERAVAEANRRVRSMIESAPFSIITSDVDGIIDCVNPAAERLTLYSAAELIGGEVQPIHDRSEVVVRAAELSREYGRIVEPGLEVFTHLAKRGVTEDREWTYIRKDGSRVPVQLAVSALRDTDGEITGYMGIAYDISERKRREDYTRHVATHDFLTGLPMRSLLGDRLQVAMARARRDHRKVGVMMLDIDHFKRINDSLGHHVGDELLKSVAERLQSCVRAADTVARLGGDEFVVVLPDVNSVADVERVATDIIRSVSAIVTLGSHDLHVTPSIGVAMFPDDADNAHDVMRDADTAMYRAKAAGRCGYRVFTLEMERAATDRMVLENALRRALDKQELEVHYQPQIGLEEGHVIGMEALVRWTDKTLGAVSPAQFIPVAEECGLILPLGEWVLRTACHDARRLQQQTGQPLRVAVNLSSHQVTQIDLLPMIESALRESGLAAQDLELEITESVLMEQTELATLRLAEIRALGVSIAIDDFGTGFSSLAYVTRFPIDTLKIDRSFVAKVNDSAGDAAVAQAIIALARSLDIHVVAEGVETVHQLAFLRDRCCDAAQGYLLGKAVAIEKFSVQGFHFGKACTAAEFSTNFAALRDRSEASVRAVSH